MMELIVEYFRLASANQNVDHILPGIEAQLREYIKIARPSWDADRAVENFFDSLERIAASGLDFSNLRTQAFGFLAQFEAGRHLSHSKKYLHEGSDW